MTPVDLRSPTFAPWPANDDRSLRRSSPTANHTAAPRTRTRCNPDAATLIADCGQPHWPGWQILAWTLFAIAGWHAVNTGDQFIRPSRIARPSIDRAIRTGRAKD